MIGMMAIISKASFQLMMSSKILDPIIRKIEEEMDTMACETNSLMESTSAVRLVKQFGRISFFYIGMALPWKSDQRALPLNRGLPVQKQRSGQYFAKK